VRLHVAALALLVGCSAVPGVTGGGPDGIDGDTAAADAPTTADAADDSSASDEDEGEADSHGADVATADAPDRDPDDDIDRGDLDPSADADGSRDAPPMVDAADATADTQPDPVGSVRGTVTYEDRPYDASGFAAATVVRPARTVVVELVDALTGERLAESVTDGEGRFVFPAPGGTRQLQVRALSAGVVEGLEVEVRDRGRAPKVYLLRSAPFAAADAANVVLLARAADPIGGAMNIVDVTGEAFRLVRRHTADTAPALRFSWQQGSPFGCGSCYVSGTIQLGGGSDDTDEYDDDIILHEISHYIVHRFSADASTGGAHRDRLVPPVLAYGEGLGYFLASLIRTDPTMVDTFADAVRFIDYEAVTLNGQSLDDFYGTTDGTVRGNQREELVAAILWDAFDPPSDAEPFDTVALGEAAIMRVLLEYIPRRGRTDVGAPRIDLADFIQGVVCMYPDAAAGMQQLANERRYPFNANPADCP
jgi:hypothetical protein